MFDKLNMKLFKHQLCDIITSQKSRWLRNWALFFCCCFVIQLSKGNNSNTKTLFRTFFIIKWLKKYAFLIGQSHTPPFFYQTLWSPRNLARDVDN